MGEGKARQYHYDSGSRVVSAEPDRGFHFLFGAFLLIFLGGGGVTYVCLCLCVCYAFVYCREIVSTVARRHASRFA